MNVAGRWAVFGLALVLAVPFAGCTRTVKPEPVVDRYEDFPLREVPPYLEGTLLESTNLENTGDLQVSGYGLVTGLDYTGDATAPLEVRQYILKEMLRNGIGTANGPMPGVSREAILEDPRVSIVRVDALIPAGANKGSRYDVQVSTLNGNETSSLAGGHLWATTLRSADRVTQFNPGELVNVLGRARGPIFVNPAHAFDTDPESASARLSLRTGLILNGGVSNLNRPLALRIRQPRLSTARFIEQRIQRQFQNEDVAAAQDEAVVFVTVPEGFDGDWEHFAGVVLHLYPSVNEAFAASKARELVVAAVEPDAPLQNISYALEGLGSPAVPVMSPLIDHANPDVAYAVARAAAYLNDPLAQRALMQMARQESHPFQLEAVETLGRLSPTPQVSRLLRELLNVESPLVRIEAYRALSRHNDGTVIRQEIGDKFVLDLVPSDGEPLIYATRNGVPRLAMIGRRPQVKLPVAFATEGRRLTINTDPQRRDLVVIYDRGPGGRQPSVARSAADLSQIVSRLGGRSVDAAPQFNFTYAEILAVVNALDEQQLLADPGGGEVALQIEAIDVFEDVIRQAPRIPDARPEAESTSQDDSGTLSDESATLYPAAEPPVAVTPGVSAQ